MFLSAKAITMQGALRRMVSSPVSLYRRIVLAVFRDHGDLPKRAGAGNQHNKRCGANRTGEPGSVRACVAAKSQTRKSDGISRAAHGDVRVVGGEKQIYILGFAGSGTRAAETSARSLRICMKTATKSASWAAGRRLEIQATSLPATRSVSWAVILSMVRATSTSRSELWAEKNRRKSQPLRRPNSLSRQARSYTPSFSRR